MLEKNIKTSLSTEFSTHIEKLVNYISQQLGNELWLELVSFLPKHNHQEQREFLRRAMIHLVTEKIQNTEIQTHSYSLPEALLSLNSLYKPGTSLKNFPLAKVSLSHCKDYGVFICSPKLINDKQDIGVDLEVSTRVSTGIINKISSPVEIFEAPSPAHLWTAKEASFKAVTPNSTQIIGDIHIHSWKQIQLTSILIPVWEYKFSNTQEDKKYTGIGWALSFTNYSLALSYLDSN